MNKLLAPLLISLLLLPSTGITADKDKAKETKENQTIVTVNGVAITEDQIRHFMAKQPSVQTPQEAVREMINVELVNQAARDENLMEDTVLQLELQRSAAAVIAATYLQRHLTNLEITDEEVEARYKAEYVDGGENAEYNASHILVKTEAEAQDIIKKLGEGGDFAELAKTHSTGPSGKKGGALGWFKKEDMVAPFSQATMELEKGKVSSAPVKTQFGWHVILLNDKRKSPPPKLEEVHKSIATSIAADSIKNKLKSLHDAATIIYAEEETAQR